IKNPGFERVFTLRSELDKVRAGTHVEEGFSGWYEARITEVDERRQHGKELRVYLEMLEAQREAELKILEEQREQAIKTRLLGLGWTEQDMKPSPANYYQWCKLICQPKPLTDRIWKNLRPKLIPMLKSNRTYNEEVEKKLRRRNRITRIGELVTTMSRALPPLVHVTLEPAAQSPGTNESSTFATLSQLLPEINVTEVKVDMPYPSMTELLAWPMTKTIVDTDTPPEDAETSFSEIQEEFKQAVVEWRSRIEQDLVDIWNAGRDEDRVDETKPGPSTSKGQGKGKARIGTRRNTRRTKNNASATQPSSAEVPVEPIFPELTVTYGKPDGTTTTNVSDLSSNVKLLLRADTIFSTRNWHACYPVVVPPAAISGRNIGAPPETLYGWRWKAEDVKRDNEKSAVAKELLARLGRSGATTAEMKALGANFRCGRCTQPLPEPWDEMVYHFVKEEDRWKQAQAKMQQDPKSNLVYHNLHDLCPDNTKPAVLYMTAQATADYMMQQVTHGSHTMTCKVCERMGIPSVNYIHGSNEIHSPMVEHLQDVHDVAQAIPGLHFRPWVSNTGFFEPFDDEDDEDDDLSEVGEIGFQEW
ncbi:hypothetical protein FRC07_010376, partial [Ceratobasidium sp. 392]